MVIVARKRRPEPDPRIAALRGEPPSRFVAARDALARELEAAGDPRARAVRALRRPPRRVWILNRLARERPAELEAALAAGERLRRAHAAALRGRAGAALRDADEAMSAALDALVVAARGIAAAAGRQADHAMLVGLREDLRAAATAGGADADRLRAGVLDRPPAAAGGWGLVAAPTSGAERRRTRKTAVRGSRARRQRGAGGGGGTAVDATIRASHVARSRPRLRSS